MNGCSYPKIKYFFRCCRVILFCTITSAVLAQPTAAGVWEQMELTGTHFKVIAVPTIPKDKKFPIWIPITGSAVTVGIITWASLKPGEGPPPQANGDSFTVPCGPESFSVEVLSNDIGDGIAITGVSAPSGISVTIGSGGNLQISGAGANSFSFSYTISDEKGRTSSATVQINITDTAPPEISCPSNRSFPCGSETGTSVAGTATVSDLCSGTQVTISFTDNTSGLTGCNNTGSITRTFTATDAAGNSSQCTQTITISPDDTPPAISCPSNVSLECGQNTEPVATGIASATDICSPSVNITFTDNTGGFSDCNNTGTLVRTWTATDACGKESSCVQTITVKDNTPPILTCPPNTSVECHADRLPPATGIANAEDFCDGELTVVFEDNDSGLTSCSHTGNVVRTWTATDGCGHQSSCTQTITITDQTPPSLECPPTATVACNSTADPTQTGTPEIADNCMAGHLELLFSDDDSGVVNCMGEIIRSWTVIDECGNSNHCTQKIKVEPPLCTFTTTFSVTNANCGVPNGSAAAQVSPPGNYTYQWSNGATGSVLSEVFAGTYTVTITAVGLGCSLTFNTTVGQLPPKYVSGLMVQPANCPMGGNVSFTLSSTTNTPFQVMGSGPGGSFSVSNVPSGAVFQLREHTFVHPGDYVFQVFNVASGPSCTETFSVFVPQAPPYQIQILHTSPPSSPSINNGFIVVQVEDPSHPPPFRVYLNGVFIGIAEDFIFSIQNLPAGVYEIQVFDVNNCPSAVAVAVLMPVVTNAIVMIPSGSQITPLPDLLYSGPVEHPLKEEWKPSYYIPLYWNALEYRRSFQENYQWQFGFSQSFGTAGYRHHSHDNILAANLHVFAARQEFFRQFYSGRASLGLGAGLYQHLFVLSQSPFELKQRFNWGLSLSGSLEFKIGKQLTYNLPVSVMLRPNGKVDFQLMPVFYYALGAK